MLSEAGFLFLVALAVVLFLAGFLGKKPLLAFFSGGLFVINAFMSGNVGDGTTLFLDYIFYGYIMVSMAIIAFLTAIVGMMSNE